MAHSPALFLAGAPLLSHTRHSAARANARSPAGQPCKRQKLRRTAPTKGSPHSAHRGSVPNDTADFAAKTAASRRAFRPCGTPQFFCHFLFTVLAGRLTLRLRSWWRSRPRRSRRSRAGSHRPSPQGQARWRPGSRPSRQRWQISIWNCTTNAI